MEVRRFVRDPAQKRCQGRIGSQRPDIVADTLELAVAEGCMDRAMADRMDGRDNAPAFGLGDGMMPFYPTP